LAGQKFDEQARADRQLTAERMHYVHRHGRHRHSWQNLREATGAEIVPYRKSHQMCDTGAGKRRMADGASIVGIEPPIRHNQGSVRKVRG
jgi:hypothetical protein